MRLLLLAAALTTALASRALAGPAILTLNEEDGLPFLACSFDGLTAKCLWDSGSERTNVPNAPPLDAYRVEGLDAGRESVRVGSLRFDSCELGPGVVWRGAGGDPVLGADLLAVRRYEIVPAPGPRLIVDPDGVVEEPSLPIHRDRQNRVVVEIGLGTRRVHALWDTGTANTRVSRAAIAAAMPGEFEKTGEYASRKESGSRYRLSVLSVGGAEFKDVEVLNSDFGGGDVAVILGWDVIRRLDWRFDARRGRWSASRPTR